MFTQNGVILSLQKAGRWHKGSERGLPGLPTHLPIGAAEASVGFTAPTPTHLPTGAAEASLGTMRRLASPSPLVPCSHPPLLTCIEIFWLVSRLHG